MRLTSSCAVGARRALSLLLMMVLLALGTDARAQQTLPYAMRSAAAGFDTTRSILRNSVSTLHARGDSLWVGPYLNLTVDGGQTWLAAATDSLFGTRNRMFSLDVEGDVVWVGLGYSSSEDGETVPAAGGFLVSRDGGETFAYRSPQLDAAGDSTVTYGGRAVPALPVIVPQQSPPYDIDYAPLTGAVWMAGWASGIRRSTDGGETWQRVVLPPDDKIAIASDSTYDFVLAPRRAGEGNYNHMGFSVLVDETGTVWAGTPAGINRSTDGGISWQRFSRDGTSGGLTGSWVTSIEEQPLPGRNAIWMASWNASTAGEQGRFGVTVTRDGGGTFVQRLLGERINDFAFRGAQTVYAAGDNGLFVSTDNGQTWRTERTFGAEVSVTPRVFAVATTREAVWAGTEGGLFKSTDGGQTWKQYRVNVPLDPDEPTDAEPRVDAYAYPNPFSPAADGQVRIRYASESNASVEIRIFDFSMNLIRDFEDTCAGQAQRECEATWNGTGNDGLRVANGPYFYTVDTGDETVKGKILVVE